MSATVKQTKHGRLLWIEKKTGKETIVKQGHFSLLQFLRKELRKDPVFAGGKFKITY